jgi:hypothetical protein
MRQTSASESLAQRPLPPGQLSVQLPPHDSFSQRLPGQSVVGPQLGQLGLVASHTWILSPLQRLAPTTQPQGGSSGGLSPLPSRAGAQAEAARPRAAVKRRTHSFRNAQVVNILDRSVEIERLLCSRHDGRDHIHGLAVAQSLWRSSDAFIVGITTPLSR